MKILGMGNALVDVLALIEDDKVLNDMQLPKGSMQLVDKEKMSKLNVAIADVEKLIASGGSASNTITAMAKLGIEAGFIGKIGEDFYGKYFLKDLVKFGVRPHLTQAPIHSGVATTFISRDGERTFGTYLGAAAELCSEDLRTDYFSGYDYFYIEGYLVQNLSLVTTAMRKAKDLGLKVIIDLASFNVVEENRQFLLETIPQYVDIVFANREESYALLETDIDHALDILSKQVSLAVIKDGANGSYVQQGDKRAHIQTHKIQRLDTTGAGDMYAAGFLYGMLKGYPHEVSGKIGNYLAECVIQVIGAKLSDEKWTECLQTISRMEKAVQ